MSLGLPRLARGLSAFNPRSSAPEGFCRSSPLAMKDREPARSPGNYAEASRGLEPVPKTKNVAELLLQPAVHAEDRPDRSGPACPGRRRHLIRAGRRLSRRCRAASMATPHIAGLAALLFQAKPTATIDEVESAIFRFVHPTFDHDRGPCQSRHSQWPSSPEGPGGRH